MGSFFLLQILEKLSLHPLSLFPIFLTLLLLYKWLYTNNHNTHKKKYLPPSPPKLPILGNLHQLGKLPHRSLHSLSQKYGELMLLQLGSIPTLVVSSANAAREIMKTHDVIFSNRPKSSMANKIFYNGKDVAFANYGKYWRQMKSICVLQLLSKTRVQSFRTIREEETTQMMENIKRLAPPTAVNLSEMIITLTHNIVCRAAFGGVYTGEERRKHNIKEVMQKFVELMGVFKIGDFIPWMSWMDKVNRLEGKADKVMKELDMLLEGILEEHLDGDRSYECKGEKVKDFVDVLIEVQREKTSGLPIDRESIKAIIMDMFAGGTDTTYTSIEWAMSELLKHPRVLQDLQEEMRTITKGKAGINDDDMEEMKYLKAVIKETLRLHPPIPLLVFRESTCDVKLNGYEIAAGTQVITNAWAIQRDSSFWEEPDDFRPERFLTSSVDFKGNDFQLIPFGAGRRGCPGVLFATKTTELVLASLVYEFDWTLPGGAKSDTLDMDESSGIAIHRRHPLLAVATPYNCK